MTDFSPVVEKFNDLLKRHPAGCAAQVAVYYNDKLEVNLAGTAPGTQPITTNTPFITFSVSKAFTAAAIWKLLEEGKIELDAPVARYWPEFGQKGKETATIRHALLHQVGIPAPHLKQQLFLWPSWRLVTRNVAREKALFPPGTQTAYHLVNFGFILGEVVRRVTGIPIDQYLYTNFFEPMKLTHTWMRIPKNALRSSPRLLLLPGASNQTVWLFNLPCIRHALIPAAGLHSNACELATFFQMLLNGGSYQGRQYLKPETIDLAAHSHYDGYDSYIKSNINWGLGLIIAESKSENFNPMERSQGYGSSIDTFSALGMGTCMVWADRNAKLVTAFTCNGMMGDDVTHTRWSALSNSVWDSIKK
jgi:CubicO group peptidase (beta-lactamase class C family)